METLKEHNARVGSAGVACDKCGAGMNIDVQKKRLERMSVTFEPLIGEPVVCPKCGYTGRKHHGF